MNIRDHIYLGVKSSVVALHKATGEIVWQTELKSSGLGGAGFVNVWFEGDAVFAHASGELHCLDAVTGQVRWKNELKGFGYGLATFASAQGSSPSQMVAAIEQIRRQAEQQRQSASSTTTP